MPRKVLGTAPSTCKRPRHLCWKNFQCAAVAVEWGRAVQIGFDSAGVSCVIYVPVAAVASDEAGIVSRIDAPEGTALNPETVMALGANGLPRSAPLLAC